MQMTQVRLPYVLEALGRSAFSGSLNVREGEVKRQILFDRGAVVQVLSGLQDETLGRLMLEQKKISPAEYQNLLEIMAKNQQPVGEILVSLGCLTSQEVVAALEFQVRKKLVSCFQMLDYQLDWNNQRIPARKHITRVGVPEALFLGLRLTYSLERLLSEFPVDEETTFLAKPPKLALGVLGPVASGVLKAIGTGTTLGKLMTRGFELRGLLATLYALHALRWVEASGLQRPDLSELHLPTEVEPTREVANPDLQAVADEIEIVVDVDIPPAVDPRLADFQMDAPLNERLVAKSLLLGREDHFKLLGVDPQVDEAALLSAYQRLVTEYFLDQIDSSYSSPKERELARRLLERARQAVDEIRGGGDRQAYQQASREQQDQSTRERSLRVMADVEAHKGEQALAEKRYDEARDHFQQAIRCYPRDASYHFRLGLTAYEQGNAETPADQPLPEDVPQAFFRALSLNPRYDQPYLYLGYCFKRSGDPVQALRAFEAAADCNPQCRPALAEIQMLRKRPGIAWQPPVGDKD